MSKHTPGPWVVGEWSETLGYDCMTAGVRVGPVVLDGADYGQRRCQPIQPEDKTRLLADARLIAAAPDLLAALAWALPLAKIAQEEHRMRRVMAGHNNIIGTRRSGVTWVGLHQHEIDEEERAEAALAKAEGK